jgi:hypothetical protein
MHIFFAAKVKVVEFVRSSRKEGGGGISFTKGRKKWPQIEY